MKVRGSGFTDLYRLEALAHKDPRRALREACREFEAVFLETVLRGLDRTVLRSGLFPESLETRLYRDLYYQELARELSGKGLGLSELLYRRLSQSLPQTLKDSQISTEKGGRRNG
ncbi:hypothetical protein FVE67_07020 [Thermosulfurimonas marina]|uniref:Flagellar protein FlgJ N-terminal domain-containing protein n=1 Tax=Thermosulfurimonas marina TaxID=2047767 RepID=A0A6H1WTQ6_9BACT|nr:rod-binding protein [Thermosulfurimonas marina]QJA06560.1 hypothetical protein FVE67_07020 [Thermosulfurimonas marina]